MDVESSAPFEASYGSGLTGLVGTVEAAVLDGDNNVVIGPTTADIAEQVVDGSPNGIYVWNCPAAPAVASGMEQFFVAFSPDGTWDPVTTSSPDELNVYATGTVPVPQPIAPPSEGGPGFGPATAWTTAEAVAECCELETGTDPEVFQPFVDTASQLLFAFSGRLYRGLDSKEGVRPLCRPGCACGQVLSRGYFIPASRQPFAWDWWGVCSGPCDPSRVLLSGYPVREITQVKIDGDVLDPSEYRLDRYRWLVRLNGEAWPACQNLGLADTEEGTWSVSYTFGQNPPLAGQDAAAELACQLYKNCGGDENCAIPAGAVRLIRQGVVIERGIFKRDPKTGAWATGMMSVDMFLNGYNPAGLTRRPMVQGPASRMRYARKVG